MILLRCAQVRVAFLHVNRCRLHVSLDRIDHLALRGDRERGREGGREDEVGRGREDEVERGRGGKRKRWEEVEVGRGRG